MRCGCVYFSIYGRFLEWGSMGKIIVFRRIKQKFCSWLYKKRWHTLWKFQIEITSNKTVIAKKPLTNLYKMNSRRLTRLQNMCNVLNITKYLKQLGRVACILFWIYLSSVLHVQYLVYFRLRLLNYASQIFGTTIVPVSNDIDLNATPSSSASHSDSNYLPILSC